MTTLLVIDLFFDPENTLLVAILVAFMYSLNYSWYCSMEEAIQESQDIPCYITYSFTLRFPASFSHFRLIFYQRLKGRLENLFSL